MIKTNFQQKALITSGKGVVLLRGTNQFGYKFYMYLAPEKGMKEQMNADYENGTMRDFKDYGKVIKRGLGENPPEDVMRYFELTYGFKHN